MCVGGGGMAMAAEEMPVRATGVMHSSLFLSADKAHPSVLSDGIVSVRERCDSDGGLCTFHFRLPASSKGRVQTSVTLPRTSTVRQVRDALHRQERFEAKPNQVVFWTELGVQMKTDSPMTDYFPSARHTGLILVRGGNREVYVESAGGVRHAMSFRWTVHLTLADIVQAVYGRLKATCGGCPELVDLRNVRLSHGDVVLDTARCFHYPDRSLANTARLAEVLGQSAQGTGGGPSTAVFRRHRDGRDALYVVPVAEDTTVADVKDALLAKEREESIQGADNGWVAGVLHPKKINRRCIQWDDVDESVAPYGVRTVYLHRPGDQGYEPAADLDSSEQYLSFRAPRRLTPTFVSIEEDYTIPHLSDLGILPDSTLTLSFFSAALKAWSHEVPPPPSSAEDVSIKIKNGPVVRLPVDMDAPLEKLYVTLWCATGITSQEAVLLTDEGRLLHRGDTMRSLGLLPETTLLCKTGGSDDPLEGEGVAAAAAAAPSAVPRAEESGG